MSAPRITPERFGDLGAEIDAAIAQDTERGMRAIACELWDAMESERALNARLVAALEELVTVARLRGDNSLPHPCDDPLTWTARMQQAWDDADSILAEVQP